MPDGMTRREFLRLALLGAVSPRLLAACSSESRPSVNFFNWSTYIAKDTLPDFTRDTGIEVNYNIYADEEEMFAKLRSGAMSYDVIVGTDYMIDRLRSFNIIAPIPPGALKNRKNIMPIFQHPAYDPKGEYTAAYLWGTSGIGYNKNKISKPPDSWRDLWSERYAGKISMLDNARDCVSLGLLLEGYPETTTDEKAYEKVKDLLIKQKPLVRSYTSSNYVDDLISGETWISMAWSGDILQALNENPELDYLIPKEGGYRWVDSLCLVRGAPHPENALRLMDYLLEGKVAADIANAVRYASPNAAARPYLNPKLLKDPRAYPPPSVEKRLRFHAELDPVTVQLWDETWSEVKVS
jgi:spermidine/putrescine transport system substrate-binding protein